MNSKLTFAALIAIVIGLLVALYIASQDKAASVDDAVIIGRDELVELGDTPEPDLVIDTPDTPDTQTDNGVIIGMTVAQAQAYAEAAGVPFRIGFQDGEYLAVTMDYRPGRITASVTDGVVTDYSVE